MPQDVQGAGVVVHEQAPLRRVLRGSLQQQRQERLKIYRRHPTSPGPAGFAPQRLRDGPLWVHRNKWRRDGGVRDGWEL